MITVTTADKILKTVYLDVICDQLNNKTNPFIAAIKKGSEEIIGKSATQYCRYGINGGMGSSSETGALPKSGCNNYISLVSDLKNIFGTIEISDKALRASQDQATSLVNILNTEMEGLLEAAKFNFSRMIWQTGTGVLTTVAETQTSPKSAVIVKDLTNIVEGMVLDFINGDTLVSGGHRITRIDRTTNKLTISPSVPSGITIAEGNKITLQQSYNMEINGIPYLFDNNDVALYGNARSAMSSILPLEVNTSDSLSTNTIQTVLDSIESTSNNDINMLITGFETRREYLNYMQATRTNVDYMNIDGGFKTLSYNGIPLVADKFCLSNSIYFLNTEDFKLVELCDWQWITGDNGSILNQLEKTPTYTGTLVKYANLMCKRPFGQAVLNFN